MIPLYTIEEHHEAFYLWNKATEAGYIPPFGNTLLHIDHHSDFECGIYDTDWKVLFGTLDDMHSFTYNTLGIADFICPAIYQGIFNDVVILKDFTLLLSPPEEKMIKITDENLLSVEPISVFSRGMITKPESDIRLFTYRQGGLGVFKSPQSVVMDIDLDYFCWDDSLSTVKDKQIEITEQVYRDVTENPYHPFRIFPKKVVSAVEDNGRFYLKYTGLPNPQPKHDIGRVHKRLDVFIKWLTECNIKPCIISICRSRYSGYTPADMWQEIEKGLLERLSRLYDYERL